VAQPSKEGFLWVFNRLTGEPLWPIEERAVPGSDVPGEQTWPTQPFPLKPPPFARQHFTENDLNSFMSAEERAHFTAVVGAARNEGLFTPPGLRNTVEMPGNNGGANWGGAAVDPRKGRVYVVSKDLPCMLKLEPERAVLAASTAAPAQRGRLLYEANCQWCHLKDRAGEPPAVPSLIHAGETLSPQQIKSTITQGQGSMPAFSKFSAADLDALIEYLQHPERSGSSTGDRTSHSGSSEATRYVSGFGFMFTSSGLSPIQPPWTSLTAYDLNEGTIRWSIPLGDVPDLASKGITNTGSMFPKVGPVVTAGGLIFTGTRDGKVRAIDEDTGKVIWEKQLNTAIEGIPAVYEANGREYVVFCAAAVSDIHARTKAAVHGAYVAFALPSVAAEGS
jgi:quinoprotein glucose dehydrogenase